MYLSIEGGLNGWGVILSLVRGGHLLRLDNLGSQRDLAMFGHTSGEEQQRQAEIKVAGPQVSVEEKVFTLVWIAGHCVERPFSHSANTQSLASSHQARTLFILLFECRTCKFGQLVCVGRLNYPRPLPIEPGLAQIQDARRGRTHGQEDDLQLALDMLINRVAEMVRSLFHASRISHEHRTEASQRCIQVSS